MYRPRRAPRLRSITIAAAVLGVVLGLASVAPASAAAWSVGIRSGSAASTRSDIGPTAAPTNVVASCSFIADRVQVTWTPVASTRVTYTIYQSRNGAAYTVADTGVTGSSWTSPLLLQGTYAYKVAAFLGTNWAGPQSSATASRTISLQLICT